MGLKCGSLRRRRYEERSAKAKSDEIDRQLDLDEKARTEVIKILILGTAESGKTTFLKQIQQHNGGFERHEWEALKTVIGKNILEGMVALLRAMEALNFNLQEEHRRQDADRIIRLNNESNWVFPFDDETFRALERLWTERQIEYVYKRRHEFHITDSLAYFLNGLERFRAQGYCPNEEDLMRVYAPTNAINVLQITKFRTPVTIIDMGGRRTKRRKWINQFDDVNLILFIAAVNEYNQKLKEDNTINRIHESMNLFEEIANQKFFKKVPIVLFLNKTDLFEQKLKETDITVAFPDCQGGKNYRKCMDHIEAAFKSRSPPGSVFKVYETCITNSIPTAEFVELISGAITERNARRNGIM
ncbi:unnamed protein product [Caenorhabditis sp. 36 PRJEB53466]|nr:unnamed protein product [Caenorhabditis sp. 36 PRJEB53466]